MKKTENISLGGYAFTIEYDAYLELEEYIGSIRNAFSNDPSADEIVTDIEERIAELLKEKCISGMVVNLAMVESEKGSETRRPWLRREKRKSRNRISPKKKASRPRRTGKIKDFTEISRTGCLEEYVRDSVRISV